MYKKSYACMFVCTFSGIGTPCQQGETIKNTARHSNNTFVSQTR